jgi:TolA-binding protein
METDSARFKLQQEALGKARQKLAKELPQGESPPAWGAPEVAASAVPMQPGEQKSRDFYQRLMAAAPESPLATQARFELAELHCLRGDNDAGLELLAVALGNSPPAEMAERIRLRMAASFLARDDGKSALAQARLVLQNQKGPLVAEARYLAGEALIRQKEWPKAIETLLPFRDQGPLQNVPGVTDRALLRLGYAYGQANQWEQSRRTLEAMLGRFGQSRWVDEARYGMGLALQNMKRFDEAVNQYAEVTKRTSAEVAARAQFQIGVCRMEQKRYADAAKALIAVAYTYDYPDWTAPAWYEAGRALAEEKKTDDAAKLWRRVVQEYPTSKWAPLAQQRLAELSQAKEQRISEQARKQ